MDMEYRELFAERLTLLRKKHNLLQKDISVQLSITPQAYSLLEKVNRSPSFENLIALSNYFGVSIDYLTGRSDNPQYEIYIDNAEAALLGEAENFIALGDNAEFLSENEALGATGRFIKNFYNSHKPKYTAPLAILKLIFAVREMASNHLNPKTIKVHLITPKPFRKSNLLNPKAFLQDRGIIPQDVLDINPLKAGEKTPIQLLTEELDKLEEDYNRSKSSQNPET